MSLFAKRPDDTDRKVHELLDIIAEEVSDVDRAANRRTYLVVKRRTDMNRTKESIGAEVVTDDKGNLTAVAKATADDGRDEETNKGETKEAKQALVIPSKVKAALLRAASEALERLTAAVAAIKDAEEGDEQPDKPMPDSVARELRAVCDMLGGTLERFPAPNSQASTGKSDKAEVAKAGAKMARTRRDQLKNAIEVLQKLLEEVMPDKSAPRGAPPGDRSTDPNRANVGAGVQPDRDAARSAQEVLSDVPGLADVLKSLSSLGEVMNELRSKVQGQDEEIARLKKSTGLPASREVDAVRRTKPTDDSVSWPLDMNRPLSREQVAKEVSFFD